MKKFDFERELFFATESEKVHENECIWEPRHRGIRNVLVVLDQVLLRYF